MMEWIINEGEICDATDQLGFSEHHISVDTWEISKMNVNFVYFETVFSLDYTFV